MVQYHVTLASQGLLLDLASYRKRARPPFADRVGSGDRSYDELEVEQIWELTDWTGGDGAGLFVVWDSDNPGEYRAGTGLDGFTADGTLRVGPNLDTSFDSSESGFTVLQSYNGKLYAGTADGDIYEFNGSSWSLSRATGKSTGGISSMAVYRRRLYVGNGQDGVVDRYDGTSWTAGIFTVASVAGIHAMTVFGKNDPLLYVVADNAPPVQAEIHSWDNTTLSGNLFKLDEPSCRAIQLHAGRLWVFGADTSSVRGAVYRFDGTNWERWLDQVDNYVQRASSWNEAIWLGMAAGGELWRFDTGDELRVIARNLTAAGDKLNGLAVWRGALWLSARNGSGVRLRRLDADLRWSEPCAGGSVDSSADSVQGLAAYAGDLYTATKKSGDSFIYRVQASGSYPTSAKTLETKVFNAGLGVDTKVWRSITLNFSALTSGQSIEAQYRLEDNGAWTSAGAASTVGSTTATFSLSGVVGKALALRLLLTSTSTATAVLYEVLVRYFVQVVTRREWVFEARYEGTAQRPMVTLDGASDPQTGAQIAATIWTKKGLDGPLTFVDLDGTSYSVWFVEHEEKVAEMSQRYGYSTRGRLRLVEA